MRQIFISSVQKEFERERVAIKRMIETDPMIKPHFKAFVFELDAPASDKSTRQVYLDEIARSDVLLLLIGNQYARDENSEEISPTEQEYDEACKKGLVKLVMVRGKDNSRRSPKERRFLEKVSDGRTRVRYPLPDNGAETYDGLLDEVKKSIRDILEDAGILSEGAFEDKVLQGFSMADISREKIEWFVTYAVRERNANFKPDMSSEDVLRALHLLNRKNNLPTIAAVLLFGNDAQYYFANSVVKCACYPGIYKEKPNIDTKVCHGNLFSLADQAIEFVKQHLYRGVGERGISAMADDVEDIPSSAIGEAVVNAVVHRNYANAGSVQVEVYSNRVEIINPGRLHYSLTVKALYKKHESFPTNPHIANAMYLVGYIESLGTGITDLLRSCRKHGLKRPSIEEQTGRFCITLWRRSRAGAAMEKEINNATAYYDMCRQIMTDPTASVAEYAARTGLTDKTVRGIIDKMRMAGLVERIGAKRTGIWRLKQGVTKDDCHRIALGSMGARYNLKLPDLRATHPYSAFAKSKRIMLNGVRGKEENNKINLDGNASRAIKPR